MPLGAAMIVHVPGTAAAQYAAPAQLDDGWPTAAPRAVGLDPDRLSAMTDAIRRQEPANVHAVLVVRRGRLVYEEYFAGADQEWGRPLGHVVFDRSTRHDLRSVSKSVTSALLGIALGDSADALLERPLLDFFPEHADLADSARQKVTLRHALAMTAGFDWNEDIPYTDPRNDEIGMTRSGQPVRYVLARPIVTEPGAEWRYNGGLTQLLAEVTQRVSGRPLLEFARERLFSPLGITDVEWVGDLDGTPAAASGLRMRARDLAKIGALYLQAGRWQDRQVVPADWIAESLRQHAFVPPEPAFPEPAGYGFQWWLERFPAPWGAVQSYTAAGNGQQRIYVLPELDMIVTIFAGRYNDRTARRLSDRLLTEHVLPAVRAP